MALDFCTSQRKGRMLQIGRAWQPWEVRRLRGRVASRVIQQSICKFSFMVKHLRQAEFGLAEKKGEMR